MRRLLLLACAVVLVDTMLYAALAPLLPGYAEEYGLGKGGAGLLVAAYPAGVLAAALPGGFAAARFGPRRAVLGGLVVMALASVGFGFATDVSTLGLARLAQGFGSAFSWAGALSWLIAVGPRERRGEILGTAIGAAVFGALLGPVVGATAEFVGSAAAFSGGGAIALVLVVWAARTEGAPATPQPLREIGPAFRDRGFVGGLWLLLLPAFLFGVVLVLIPLELAALGWGAAAIGALFLVNAGLEATVSPLIGRFSDRRGRLAPVRLGLVASIAVSLALAWAGDLAVLVPLTTLAAVAYGTFYAPGPR